MNPPCFRFPSSAIADRELVPLLVETYNRINRYTRDRLATADAPWKGARHQMSGIRKPTIPPARFTFNLSPLTFPHVRRHPSRNPRPIRPPRQRARGPARRMATR